MGQPFAFGSFSYDDATGTLWRDGKLVPLGARAAAILHVLLQAAGAVVTRDGGSKVFEVVGEKAVLRTVTTGAVRGDRVIVTDGLAGSETLIDRPAETLKDGTAVRVRP